MKTIADYTIHCTEAQTKRAFALGAPIEKTVSIEFDITGYVKFSEDGEKITWLIPPTAEQMIGFILATGKGYAADLATLLKEYGYEQGCLLFIDNSLK